MAIQRKPSTTTHSAALALALLAVLLSPSEVEGARALRHADCDAPPPAPPPAYPPLLPTNFTDVYTNYPQPIHVGAYLDTSFSCQVRKRRRPENIHPPHTRR